MTRGSRTRSLDIARRIAAAGPFAGTPASELRVIAPHIEVLHAVHDVLLVPAGAAVREFYIVESGSIDVYDGCAIVDVLVAGECSDPRPLLTHMPSEYELTAARGSVILILDRRQFTTALDVVPGFARRLLTLAANWRVA
jgi:signal-transduction protein with cAMP-binding, CBS, and nucleotidyltransferase domain